MKKRISTKQPSAQQPSAALEIAVCILLSVAGLFYFSGSFKVLTLLAGVGAIALLLRRDSGALGHPVSLLLLAYVLVAGLSIFWALSGKFFLREFSKIFVAACCFAAVLLLRNFGKGTVRTLLSGMAVIGAVYSFLSVEYVTTGLSKVLLQALIPGMAGVNVTVEAGNRLTGILASPNPTASILSFSIFFAIYLMCTEEGKGRRLYYAGVLALNAYTFLMLFSMAGTGLFALSLLVYLAVAGEKRGGALVRMLIGALPTLVWVFVGFPFLTAEGALKAVPLLAMAANVATVVLLEKVVADRLIPVLEQRARLALGAILALVALAVAYVVIAMNVGSPYTFGEGFRRSVYLDPGPHTITVQADGDVTYHIISQNEAETIMHTSTYLGGGGEGELTFQVPEGSKVCYIDFSAAPGVTLEQALVDGTEEVKLKYPLLPAFIANRMQGLWANQNVIQRTAFFDDGMKLFYRQPLRGNGVGSFETGVTSVQEFSYETKYIHNHYIQVLEECGILGFLPFVGALAGLVFLLWKKRKGEDWAYGEAYAPLCAALFMTLTHIAFEVSLSNAIFLCYAYVTFGVIVRCCGEERGTEAAPDKKKADASKSRRLPLRVGMAVFSGAFAVSLCGNLLGNYLLDAPVYSEDAFMENLITAAKADLYEKNDAKLSYVVVAMGSENLGYYRAQADEYAGQLQKVQSNSIPKVLTQYYLSTMQFREATQAALAGAAYSASDAATWNDTISLFRILLDDPAVFSLYDTEKALSDGIMAYYEALRGHNAESMEDIALELSSKDFFGKMRSVAAAGGTPERTAAILEGELFRSSTACDANSDLVPDQVSWHSGVTFLEGGGMEMTPDGRMDLDLYCEAISGTIRMKVFCSDPSAVSLYSHSAQQMLPAAVEAGCAVFELPAAYQQENALKLQLSSSAAQRITALEAEYAG